MTRSTDHHRPLASSRDDRCSRPGSPTPTSTRWPRATRPTAHSSRDGRSRASRGCCDSSAAPRRARQSGGRPRRRCRNPRCRRLATSCSSTTRICSRRTGTRRDRRRGSPIRMPRSSSPRGPGRRAIHSRDRRAAGADTAGDRPRSPRARGRPGARRRAKGSQISPVLHRQHPRIDRRRLMAGGGVAVHSRHDALR